VKQGSVGQGIAEGLPVLQYAVNLQVTNNCLIIPFFGKFAGRGGQGKTIFWFMSVFVANYTRT
jgi:hypothetical protein